ncbi:hypothetical protein ACOSP6_07170 [Tenacibaculum sp. MEBiC06402]|uniref:hypothetical protein n=1 Tax=unclassified Tenacibaculum TaxID=2635139 RepID=UPI003B9D4BD7
MKIKFLIIFFLSAVIPKESPTNTDNDGVTLGSWEIKNGIFIENNDEETNIARYNWNIFYNMFPKRITQRYIKKLVLMTDGEDEKTGALGALNDKNNEWQLVLDPIDVDFTSKDETRISQSIYTLVHEFGHLLTLNHTQIKPVKKTEQQKGDPYVTIEGTAVKNSYINKFVDEFWDGGLLKEWDYIQRNFCVTEQKSCLEKLYGLYKDNYTDFLTDYAAESPEEDIAESWTAFVLGEKIKNPQTIAEKKINFFYQFEELVYYRKVIRKNTRKYQ